MQNVKKSTIGTNVPSMLDLVFIQMCNTDEMVVTVSSGSDIVVSRGLVVKVLNSKFKGCEFKTHTGHGSFSKLRQFHLP